MDRNGGEALLPGYAPGCEDEGIGSLCFLRDRGVVISASGLSKPELVVLYREAKQLGLELDQDGIYEDRKEKVSKKLIDDVVILINPARR